MPVPLTSFCQIPAFTAACGFEPVFGSRALTALRAYGLSDDRARFYLCGAGAAPDAALYLTGGVLTVSAREGAPAGSIAELARAERVSEIDSDAALCTRLRELLGGEMESSYYMAYQGVSSGERFPDIVPGEMETVFSILQQSHDYYREHLRFPAWADDLEQKLTRGLAELYQLEFEGRAVGTGCIVSEDDSCGVIAAVAVVPAYRHRGLGGRVTRFLTDRILAKGKTPRLISGYDAVAELYRGLGFETCGRWGELYL